MNRYNYRGWLHRPCTECGARGRHRVIFGRVRCDDCYAWDRQFVAWVVERERAEMAVAA